MTDTNVNPDTSHTPSNTVLVPIYDRRMAPSTHVRIKYVSVTNMTHLKYWLNTPMRPTRNKYVPQSNKKNMTKTRIWTTTCGVQWRKKKEERRKKEKIKTERVRREECRLECLTHVFSMFIFLVVFVFLFFLFEKKNFALRFRTSNNTNKKNRETRGKRIQQQHNICLWNTRLLMSHVPDFQSRSFQTLMHMKHDHLLARGRHGRHCCWNRDRHKVKLTWQSLWQCTKRQCRCNRYWNLLPRSWRLILSPCSLISVVVALSAPWCLINFVRLKQLFQP